MDTLEVSVAVTPDRLERRGLGRLFGGGDKTPIRVTWKETPGERGPGDGRTLAVNVSALKTGEYHLTITASTKGQAPVSVDRDFSVRR